MSKVTHLNAGSNCKYVLTNGGLFAGETVVEFRTEQELDNYVESLLNNNAIDIDGGEVILSVDLMAKTREILDDIQHKMKSVGEEVIEFNAETEEEVTYLKIPNSIGANRFIGTAGKNGDPTLPIVTPFKLETWIERYRKKHGDSQETTDAIEAQQKLWPQLTQYGIDIHEVIDTTFKGEEYYRTTKTVISDEQITETIKYAKQLMADLRGIHGATCEFYTEFGFVSKELDDKIKPILEAEGYNSINGKADLLVVDQFGNVHIYDFKVSRKTVGEWSVEDNDLLTERDFSKGIEGDWHSTKKRGATNQLAIYKAILGQYGLHVSSGNIIPIKLNFNYKSEFEIDNLDSISFPNFSDNILNVPGSTAGDIYQNIANNILPQPNVITGANMQKTYDIWQNFCPGVKGGTIRRKEQTVESLKRNGSVKTLNSSDKRFPEYKYAFMPWGVGRKEIACKTEEELDEKLLEYVTKRNNSEANEVSNLGELISVELAGERDYTKITGNVDKENQVILQEQFKKYFIQPGWSFNDDITLTSAGIFKFTRGDEVEIVVLTNEGLFDTLNLGIGKTLLGKNTKDKHVGLRNILPASNANLSMMKAMIYIAENQEQFKGKKIVQIRAFNPWRGQYSDTVTTTTLLQNYEQLRLKNPNAGAKQIDSSIFMSDIESTIRLIQSKWEMLDVKMIDFSEKYDASQVESVLKWTNTSIAELKKNYKDLENKERQRSSEAWEAYTLLNELLLRLNRIEQVNEIDAEPWINGINLGINVTSAQFSGSKNIQEFARLHDRYVAEVRNAVQKQGFAMQKVFKELYDKTGVTGAKAFESWFVRNPNGSINNEFKLMDPEHKDFEGNETAKKALRMFLDTMYKIRYPDALETDIENAKETGDYYRVPLMETAFSRQAKNLGFFNAVKNKIAEYKELTEGVFAGETNEKEKWERENDSLYNKFRLDADSRRRKIEKHGVGFFETNLEIVFNNVLVAYNKQQISEKYVPLFKAMQVGLRRMDEDGGNNLKEVREVIDKLIDNRFYGKNIMKGHLKDWYAWLSVISRFFSTMRLGLNVRSFLRETLSGMYIGATRVMVKQHNNVSLDSYNKAVSYVIQDLPNNPSGISLVQQLNAMYGMANYSLGNVANQRKVNWMNIRNWGQDTLFIGCSAPDYQHRMSILIAKMMDDGCWNAISANESDELVYDWKKDKRFEIYAKGETSNPKYLEQKTLYLKNLEEWNAQGYRKPDGTTLREGDDLPQPYTNREGQSIKNYADILYGHYDDESRSLMNDMFIGSFFMQYKTFVTAKLEQWTMKGGIYNIEYLKQQYDPITGEKLYEIMRYPNPDGTGIPMRDIVKESNLKNLSKEEQERARPYIEWTGQPMEGMARGAWNMAKAIRHMSKEELDEIWNDPHERGLLLLGLSDLFLMGLLGLIIQALFGAAVGSEEWSDINTDVRNSNYFASLSYNVLRGVTKDNSIFSVIQSMGADMNPPFLTNLKQFAQSCYSVSTGNQSLAYALTRNIGAVSDFSGMVKQWEQLQKAVE